MFSDCEMWNLTQPCLESPTPFKTKIVAPASLPRTRNAASTPANSPNIRISNRKDEMSIKQQLVSHKWGPCSPVGACMDLPSKTLHKSPHIGLFQIHARISPQTNEYSHLAYFTVIHMQRMCSHMSAIYQGSASTLLRPERMKWTSNSNSVSLSQTDQFLALVSQILSVVTVIAWIELLTPPHWRLFGPRYSTHSRLKYEKIKGHKKRNITIGKNLVNKITQGLPVYNTGLNFDLRCATYRNPKWSEIKLTNCTANIFVIFSRKNELFPTFRHIFRLFALLNFARFIYAVEVFDENKTITLKFHRKWNIHGQLWGGRTRIHRNADSCD